MCFENRFDVYIRTLMFNSNFICKIKRITENSRDLVRIYYNAVWKYANSLAFRGLSVLLFIKCYKFFRLHKRTTTKLFHYPNY